jgi:hypothetical protein
LPLYQIHASGHINPVQVKSVISEIRPKKVYRSRLLAAYTRDLGIEIICPEEGLEYSVD